MTGTVWTTCHPLMSHHRSMMQMLRIPAVIHSVYTDWHWIGVKTAPSLWQAVHSSQQEISPQSVNVCLDQQQNYPRQIKNYVGASSVYMCQCSIIVQTFAAVTSWQVFNVILLGCKKVFKGGDNSNKCCLSDARCKRRSSQKLENCPFLETSHKNFTLPENCITLYLDLFSWPKQAFLELSIPVVLGLWRVFNWHHNLVCLNKIILAASFVVMWIPKDWVNTHYTIARC